MMAPQKRIKRSKKIGLPPGTLIHLGDRKTEKSQIALMDYSPEQATVKTLKNPDELAAYLTSPTVTWINVDGLHDTALIQKLCDLAHVHPLVQEDILNTDQRPKVEYYEGYTYLVLKMIDYDSIRHELQTEQASLILAGSTLISFQERPGDLFNTIRKRIENGQGRVRQMGSDYLCYLLMDAIVDHYFLVLEKIGDRIDELEQESFKEATSGTFNAIHRLKNTLLTLRKLIWPTRDLLNGLLHKDDGFLSSQTRLYFQDVYDHMIHIIDTTDVSRDMLTNLVEIFLSSTSNRMNEVMKVLTIIATLFIPLTFVVGIYGMNFRYMPELEWKWGYPAVLALMLTISSGLLFYFKKKKWL